MAEVGAVTAVGQFLAHGAFDVAEVGVEVVQGVVLVEQFGGGFGTDAADARDVVAGVADEGFVIDDLVGTDAEFVDDGRGVINFRRLAGAGREFDAGIGVDQLQQVAIAGDDVDGHAVGFGLLGDGSQDIIGFVAFQF